jgi:hypothetical protein
MIALLKLLLFSFFGFKQASALATPKSSNFPLSVRAALIENAKLLDDNLSKGEKTGTYSPTGWSNRLGTVLTPASIPGVYTADRPFYWNKIDVGCRMTVVQLEDGNLWVHSPVGIDQALREALKKLGTVKYIVSPNYEHLKYAPEWHQAYPDAFMWGCPGLMERMPEIKWEGEVTASQLNGDTEAPENCWDFNTITPLHVDMEVNPFTGKPFFNEVIYFHRPSKTLMTTDFYWNYPTPDGVPNSHRGGTEWELAPSVESIPFGSRLWKVGMDQAYRPFFKNLMVTDKGRYEKMVDIILDDFDVETIIPAHGDIIRGDDVEPTLREHLL